MMAQRSGVELLPQVFTSPCCLTKTKPIGNAVKFSTARNILGDSQSYIEKKEEGGKRTKRRKRRVKGKRAIKPIIKSLSEMNTKVRNLRYKTNNKDQNAKIENLE